MTTPIRPKVTALLSGGLVSTTLTYLLSVQNWNSSIPVALRHAYGLELEGYDVRAVSIVEGHRHNKGLEYAQQIATQLDVQHVIIDLSARGPSLTESSLLSVASLFAAVQEAARVATGMHAGDHPLSRDGQAGVLAWNEMERDVTNGARWPKPRLLTPFASLRKHDIVRLGTILGVPYETTWSCSKDGEQQCGACEACVERREAFRIVGVDDPTEYEPLPVGAAFTALRVYRA